MAISENKKEMTLEELRAKLLEELELVRSQLGSAAGEELEKLLEREIEIKDEIKREEAKPTVPGGGTTGEASKRMSRGQLP